MEWTANLDLAFQLSKNIEIAIGGENVLDAMPDKWGMTGQAFTSGNGVMQYPQSTPFGYNDAFYHIRLNVKI